MCESHSPITMAFLNNISTTGNNTNTDDNIRTNNLNNIEFILQCTTMTTGDYHSELLSIECNLNLCHLKENFCTLQKILIKQPIIISKDDVDDNEIVLMAAHRKQMFRFRPILSSLLSVLPVIQKHFDEYIFVVVVVLFCIVMIVVRQTEKKNLFLAFNSIKFHSIEKENNNDSIQILSKHL